MMTTLTSNVANGRASTIASLMNRFEDRANRIEVVENKPADAAMMVPSINLPASICSRDHHESKLEAMPQIVTTHIAMGSDWVSEGEFNPPP